MMKSMADALSSPLNLMFHLGICGFGRLVGCHWQLQEVFSGECDVCRIGCVGVCEVVVR